ncbi:calcium-binding protein [Streptomyces aureus]
MRSIAIGAALSGALALAVASTPAAQADESWGGDTTITSVTVNGGKPIVVGVSNKVTFSGSVTATDPDGIDMARVFVWHGGPKEEDTDLTVPFGRPACTAVDAATKTCAVTFTLDPRDLRKNSRAGQWNVAVDAFDKGKGGISLDAYRPTNVQRYSKLSVNASAEPVAKGRTITVTGKLTRNGCRGHYWRYYFSGTSTTATVKTAGDYVDVR